MLEAVSKLGKELLLQIRLFGLACIQSSYGLRLEALGLLRFEGLLLLLIIVLLLFLLGLMVLLISHGIELAARFSLETVLHSLLLLHLHQVYTLDKCPLSLCCLMHGEKVIVKFLKVLG